MRWQSGSVDPKELMRLAGWVEITHGKKAQGEVERWGFHLAIDWRESKGTMQPEVLHGSGAVVGGGKDKHALGKDSHGLQRNYESRECTRQ